MRVVLDLKQERSIPYSYKLGKRIFDTQIKPRLGTRDKTITLVFPKETYLPLNHFIQGLVGPILWTHNLKVEGGHTTEVEQTFEEYVETTLADIETEYNKHHMED